MSSYREGKRVADAISHVMQATQKHAESAGGICEHIYR